MTLSEQFPNATLDLPLEIRHEFNIFTPKNRLVAGTGGASSNVQDTYSENVANAKAIHHAISTYDAREAEIERLRTALHDAEAIGDFATELRNRLALKENAEACAKLAAETNAKNDRLREALREALEVVLASMPYVIQTDEQRAVNALALRITALLEVKP